MILADNHTADFHSTERPLHEGGGTGRGDLRREANHDHVAEAHLVEQPGLFIEGGEIRRAVIRVEHAARMWLEGDEHAGGTGRAGTGDERLQQRLVATVNAVEGADRRVARSECAGRGKAEGDRRHAEKTARGWIRRVASASPHATNSPSGPSSRYRPGVVSGAGIACPRRTAAAAAASSATAGQLCRGRSMGSSQRLHPSPASASVAIGTASASISGPIAVRTRAERYAPLPNAAPRSWARLRTYIPRPELTSMRAVPATES